MGVWWLALPLLAAFDLQNVLAYWRGLVLPLTDESTLDYTVVVPVYGHPRYLQNLRYLATIRDNVVIAIDVGAEPMRVAAARLKRYGWRVHVVDLRENIGPDSILRAVLEDGAISTKWVVRMDADTWAVDDMGR